MIGHIEDLIKSSKKRLKKKSKDFYKNFKNIENFIKREVHEIKVLKGKSESIIPEIRYNDLLATNEIVKKLIKKRGCVIIRNVFDKKKYQT